MKRHHPWGAESQSEARCEGCAPDARTLAILRRYEAGEISARQAAQLIGPRASEHDVFAGIIAARLSLPSPRPEEIAREVAALRALYGPLGPEKGSRFTLQRRVSVSDEFSSTSGDGRELQRPCRTKQMGDACEMLIAAELTLAGVPALRAPDYWPGYDVAAQRPGECLQKISVKSRTFKRGAAFVSYSERDEFDWLAIVILPGDGCLARRYYIIPRNIADRHASRYASEKVKNVREFRIDRVDETFSDYQDNFDLKRT